VNGLCVRATGAEEIVRPRRLIGRFYAAAQLHSKDFTVLSTAFSDLWFFELLA